jgi:hypothetical protein
MFAAQNGNHDNGYSLCVGICEACILDDSSSVGAGSQRSDIFMLQCAFSLDSPDHAYHRNHAIEDNPGTPAGHLVGQTTRDL